MRIAFTKENRSRGFEAYPLLKLDKGERARVSLVEPTPLMRYVHVLRKPVVIDGKIQKEMKKGKRGEYEVNVMEFAGQHLCLGDEKVISVKLADPENCVSCQAAKEHPEWFEGPKRKFAQHILRYKTQPGTFKVQDPFQGELLLWTYTDGRFDQILDIAEEHGDPRGLDLNLGPCESRNWQRFDINVAGTCEWVANEERQNFVKALMKNRADEDLMIQMIARAKSSGQIQMDMDEVIERWNEVGVKDLDDARETATHTLAASSDLDEILGASSRKRSAASDVTVALDQPSENGSADGEKPKKKGKKAKDKEEAPEPEPAETAGPVHAAKGEALANFDDILAGL